MRRNHPLKPSPPGGLDQFKRWAVRGNVEMLLKILSVLLPPFVFHLGMGLFMASVLLRLLEFRHPETYRAMGGQSLRLRNGLSGLKAVARFVLSRAYRPLQDRVLSFMSYALMLYTLIFIVSFGALAIMAARLLVTDGAAS